MGSLATFPETVPSTGNPHPASGKQMYDDEGHRICMIDFDSDQALQRILLPTDGFKDNSVCAIRHLTDEAPFDCTISADLYLSGPLHGPDRHLIGQFTGGSCAEGGQIYLGCTEYYDNYNTINATLYESNLWGIDWDVPDAGSYNLDLTVTLTPNGTGDPLSYSIRVPIRIHDCAFNAPVHSVLIVPAWAIQGLDCSFPVYVPTLSKWMSAELKVLRGPFRTQAMAQEVYDNFSSLIDLFSERCICPPGGCTESNIGFNIAVWDSAVGMYALEGYGGVGDPKGCWGCDTWYIQYDVSCGSDVVLLKTDANGVVGYIGSGQGILAPCERVCAYSNNYPDPEDPDANLKWYLGGYSTMYGKADPCPFCGEADWDFDTHAWGSPYCAYSTETFTDGGSTITSSWTYTPRKDGGPYGIPGSTEEYNDWKNIVLMRAVGIRALLDEMPENLR